MRLFPRKAPDALEVERCPYCREPLPEDAAKCVMCGASLPQAAEAQPAEAKSSTP